jgi:predicted metal-dependent peptidase
MLPEKFYQARGWLLRERPYFASLILALRPRLDETVRTMAVDAKARLYVSPSFLDRISVQEAAGVLLHEGLHILLSHFQRRGDRNPQAWNIAADLEINDDILRDKIPLPKEGIWPEKFGFPNNLLAEEYYDRFPVQEIELSDPDLDPRGDGDEEDGEGGLTEAQLDVIRRRVAEAIAEEAKRNPGSVPAGLERWARELLQPSVPWQKVLASLVRGALLRARGRQDYRLDGRNRRQALSPVVLPRLRSPEPRILVLIDASGSIQDQELGQFLGEIAGILRATGAGVDVASGDTELASFERGVLDPRKIRIRGGGGTDLGEILGQIRGKGKWDLVVVLTDGWTPWPPANPLSPTRVLVVTTDKPGPDWAKTIKIGKGA